MMRILLNHMLAVVSMVLLLLAEDALAGASFEAGIDAGSPDSPKATSVKTTCDSSLCTCDGTAMQCTMRIADSRNRQAHIAQAPGSIHAMQGAAAAGAPACASRSTVVIPSLPFDGFFLFLGLPGALDVVLETCSSLPCVIADNVAGLSVVAEASGILSTLVTSTVNDIGTVTIAMQSESFKSASACLIKSNTFSVTPQVLLDQSTGLMTVLVPVSQFQIGQKFELQCVALEFPAKPYDCCDAKNQLKQGGTVCKPSLTPCQTDARCDGVKADCPANSPANQHKSCPWYPKSYAAYGMSSSDESNLQAYVTTAAETASLTATSPVDDHEGYRWPACEGKCIDGMCALRWDHPTCCSVPRPGLHRRSQNYAALARSDQETVHPAGIREWNAYDSSLYCWR